MNFTFYIIIITSIVRVYSVIIKNLWFKMVLTTIRIITNKLALIRLINLCLRFNQSRLCVLYRFHRCHLFWGNHEKRVRIRCNCNNDCRALLHHRHRCCFCSYNRDSNGQVFHNCSTIYPRQILHRRLRGRHHDLRFHGCTREQNVHFVRNYST